MILEIRKYPDPILKKKCKPVQKITQEDVELIENMFETMHQNGGVGLSACQVGVLKQITVVSIGKKSLVLINPKILSRKGVRISEEGCLSIPGVFLKIKRAEEIEVEALNQDGKKFRIKARGLLSYCLQQEIDHLNGILILNRISIFKRIKLKLSKKI